MKEKINKKKGETRSEYDFSGGVRGKHAKTIRAGHRSVITRTDGSIEEREFMLISLSPDLQKYFPDPKSVDRALRGLVALLPEGR